MGTIVQKLEIATQQADAALVGIQERYKGIIGVSAKYAQTIEKLKRLGKEHEGTIKTLGVAWVGAKKGADLFGRAASTSLAAVANLVRDVAATTALFGGVGVAAVGAFVGALVAVPATLAMATLAASKLIKELKPLQKLEGFGITKEQIKDLDAIRNNVAAIEALFKQAIIVVGTAFAPEIKSLTNDILRLGLGALDAMRVWASGADIVKDSMNAVAQTVLSVIEIINTPARLMQGAAMKLGFGDPKALAESERQIRAIVHGMIDQSTAGADLKAHWDQLVAGYGVAQERVDALVVGVKKLNGELKTPAWGTSAASLAESLAAAQRASAALNAELASLDMASIDKIMMDISVAFLKQGAIALKDEVKALSVDLTSALKGVADAFLAATTKGLNTANTIANADFSSIGGVGDLAATLGKIPIIGTIADTAQAVLGIMADPSAFVQSIKEGIFDVIINAIKNFPDLAPMLLDAVFAFVEALPDTIVEMIPKLMNSLLQILNKVVEFVFSKLPTILLKLLYNIGTTLVDLLVKKIPQMILDAFKDVWEAIKAFFKGLFDVKIANNKTNAWDYLAEIGTLGAANTDLGGGWGSSAASIRDTASSARTSSSRARQRRNGGMSGGNNITISGAIVDNQTIDRAIDQINRRLGNGSRRGRKRWNEN